MDIAIQAVNFDATDKLRDFGIKRVSKLEKLSDAIIGAEVIFKLVKPETVNNKEASIKLGVKGNDLFASKVADSFEEALVECAEALERQLQKLKEKQLSR